MSLLLLFSTPIIYPPYLDLDAGGEKKRRKRQQEHFDDERERLAAHRQEILDAYERIVEGKPEYVAAEAPVQSAKPMEFQYKLPQKEVVKLVNDAENQRLIWERFLEMDDEEIFLLM